MMSGDATLSDYELQRAANIKSNNAQLALLGLEPLEERHRVGRRARKAAHDALLERAHLARVVLEDLRAVADLAVANQTDAALPAHAEDRRPVHLSRRGEGAAGARRAAEERREHGGTGRVLQSC